MSVGGRAIAPQLCGHGFRRPLALRIRAGAKEVAAFPVVPEESEDEVEEGRWVYREHTDRERDPKLILRKKASAKTLDCEIYVRLARERTRSVGQHRGDRTHQGESPRMRPGFPLLSTASTGSATIACQSGLISTASTWESST